LSAINIANSMPVDGVTPEAKEISFLAAKSGAVFDPYLIELD
jgi:hypothetical protein